MPQTAPASAGCTRNTEVLEKQLDEGHFNMTVRVDETKRDIAITKFGATLDMTEE